MTTEHKIGTFELQTARDEETAKHEGIPALGAMATDEVDMQRLGQTAQLKRNFNSLAVVGLDSMIMTTWLGMLAASTFSLVDGGRAGTIWLFIVTWCFQIFVIGSMAEMASMAPSSSGQYHWVSEFAPPSQQKFLSYITGWLSALGWQSIIATFSYSTGQFILILASLNGRFILKPWQGCLLTIAWVVFSALFNVFASKWLPLFETLILVFFFVCLFAVCGPLWALAPKASSADVWLTFNNGGGWSSIGGATVLGFIRTNGAFIGADAAAHMAEEVRDASFAVPLAMMFSVLFNGALALMATLTYLYSMTDIQTQILESSYAFPFIGVFHDATGSDATAIGMTIPWFVVGVAGCLSGIAAGSRQAWSFARDGGFPGSAWIARIRNIRGQPVPVNAVVVCTIITIVLALIQLGSTEAFNSIVGLVGGAFGFSYTISISCVLWRRLYGAPLPPARWSLGRWGILFNVAGCSFQMFCTVISFFPQYEAVTAMNMNWSSVMFVGVAALSTGYYLTGGRKNYTGPVAHVKQG